jgi:hypothetical protein
MTDRPRPPRLGETLLAAALGPSEWAESILGDLHEEHQRRAARAGRFKADAWYWSIATALAARYAIAGRTRRDAAHDTQISARRDSLMQLLAQEIRHAFRGIVKRPAVAAIIVGTIALGLGANAATFAMVDALVLRPFTIPDLDRLTIVSQTYQGQRDGRRETVAPGNFLDWKKQAGVFERLAAYQWWDANLLGRDEPERVQGFRVSADFFPALGMQPFEGRTFTDDEETIGRHRRVVLGHGLWQRRFGADPHIVGRPVTIDGAQYDVVGIAAPDFDFPEGAEVWAPLAFDEKTAANRTSRPLTAIGRLASGRSIDDAQAQMAVIAARLERLYPDVNRGKGARVYTFTAGLMDPGIGPMLSLWQAAAAFVLLIACANVAYLVSQQRHDIGVRMALGATGRDVLRMTIGQSGRLAAIGILLGALASVVLGRSIESGLLGIATSDMRLLALLAATLGTAALAAAYIPARRAASTDPMLSLRGE